MDCICTLNVAELSGECFSRPMGTLRGSVRLSEVDTQGLSIDFLEGKVLASELVKLLDEPVNMKQTRTSSTGRERRYPVRDRRRGSRPLVRACLLNITFDSDGVVADWGFVNPYINSPLLVKETLQSADKYLRAKYDPIPSRIEMASNVQKWHLYEENIAQFFDPRSLENSPSSKNHNWMGRNMVLLSSGGQAHYI